MCCRKVGRGEREDLEREELSFDHDKAGKGELDHGAPIVERTFGETVPALSPIDEVHIEEEEQWKEVVSNRYGNWGANETPIKVPDE
jgi:hypothetical protein